MVYVCKGVCNGIKGEKIPSGSRYWYGQKRCSMCSVFITVSGVRCPCCSALLRTKSRSRKKYYSIELV
ncbi:MAG: hypothetical protein GKS07_10615 [Nitrosopumilus sp.]|nr:MAG: hypothetical protein GKS07_10615 [Nitrosopumilus sp.]